MKLIPYEKFEINSDLSSVEVVQRIENCTGKKKFFNFSHTHEFSGHVNENAFEITKNISYRNSFLPVIVGKIKQTDLGTKITITMRLHPVVICFMLIWFTGVGIGCIAIFLIMDEFSLPMLIPFGMLIFGIALVSAGFGIEAAKQKERLIELLSKH